MPGPDPRQVRADQIFDAALDLPQAERAAYVDRACVGDPELRTLVDRLLEFADDGEEDDGFAPGGALLGALGSALDDEMSGMTPVQPPSAIHQLGDYRIVREIGRGGAGIVFLGESQAGEMVALKLLRPGVAAGDLFQRFIQERKILAGIGEHPHIARFMDGGNDAHGRPYFVLEYVEGKPIDVYCDEERLDLEARLRLFVKVARAIEHAHGRKVIHRDIKPSNVLVGPHGEPKLLDFGISKLLDPESSQVPLTRSGTQLMTPAYATPEQLLGHPPTHATDVYQLGLLLYILACGRFPYRLERTAAGVAGAIIEAPARPLVRALHEPDEDLPIPASGGLPAAELAERRRVGVEELESKLGGDLERILMAALAKDPRVRYDGVADLVGDVESFLRGRPVEADGSARSGRDDSEESPGRWSRLGNRLRGILGG